MAENILKMLTIEQKKIYNTSGNSHKNFKKLNYEDAIYSLLFIIHYLEINDYTLSHICLNDFIIQDNKLFLNNTDHLYDIKSDYISYESKDKNGIEFFTKNMNDSRVHKTNVYESIGYFIYYLLFYRVKNELNQHDLEPIFETKPYYFIQNCIDKYFIYI